MGDILHSIGSLFSPAKVPKTVVPTMPDPGSTASKIAAQAKIAKRGKQGRQGTIYSGGGAYTGTNLAGTP